MYYIYKIENLVNHKIYIGLTNNIRRRRIRHFSNLRHNCHDNSFLQDEFNQFGIKNFSFEQIFEGDITPEEIGELERYYIKQYDSYYNGYNQNEGGNFGPSNGGSHLIKTDIFSICSALEFCSRPGAVLADIFNITTTTVSRIKKKENHCQIIEEYENLSYEERRDLYKIFCESCDFINKKTHSTILKGKRKLTQEQVFLIYLNEELKLIPKNHFCNLYNIQSNTIYTILKQKSYKDYWYDYQQITADQKDKLVSLLRNQQKQISRIAGKPIKVISIQNTEKV